MGTLSRPARNPPVLGRRTLTKFILLISLRLAAPVFQFGPADPLALVVGVVAIWFVWQETKRNNTPIVKIKECKGFSQQSVYENNGQLFHEVSVVLENRGVSLWNMSVAVQFRGADESGMSPDDSGTFLFQLSPKVDRDSDPEQPPLGRVEFARGMFAEYAIKSYKIQERGGGAYLGKLRDCWKQKARICVYSQGYLACSVRVGGFWDWIKGCWNRFAYKVNRHFEKTIERPGQVPLLKAPEIIPTFSVLDHGLMYFIGEINPSETTTKIMQNSSIPAL